MEKKEILKMMYEKQNLNLKDRIAILSLIDGDDSKLLVERIKERLSHSKKTYVNRDLYSYKR